MIRSPRPRISPAMNGVADGRHRRTDALGGGVRRLEPAGLDPALQDGVRPRHPNPALGEAYSGIGRHGVQGRGEFGGSAGDEEPGWGTDGDAEDTDTAGGLLDDRQNVQASAGESTDLEERRGTCLAARERGPGRSGSLGSRVDAVRFTVEAATGASACSICWCDVWAESGVRAAPRQKEPGAACAPLPDSP